LYSVEGVEDQVELLLALLTHQIKEHLEYLELPRYFEKTGR
jgi:hypothetical protein